MAITPAQIKTSRIGLAVVAALLVGTFFIPPPALVPPEGRVTAMGSTEFVTRLAKGDELTVYAADRSVSCVNRGSDGSGLGLSLRGGYFNEPRVVDGTTYYPVAGIAGVGGGVKRVISCTTDQPLYVTSAWFTGGSFIAIVRGGLIFLALVFGWYVVMGPRRVREPARRPGA